MPISWYDVVEVRTVEPSYEIVSSHAYLFLNFIAYPELTGSEKE
jgi:hypothetical protein